MNEIRQVLSAKGLCEDVILEILNHLYKRKCHVCLKIIVTETRDGFVFCSTECYNHI